MSKDAEWFDEPDDATKAVLPKILISLPSGYISARYLPNRDAILFVIKHTEQGVSTEHFEISPRDLFDSLALDLDAIRAQAMAYAQDSYFRSLWTVPLKFRLNLSGRDRVAFDELFRDEIKAMHRRLVKRMRVKNGVRHTKRIGRVPNAEAPTLKSDAVTRRSSKREG